MPLLDTKYQNMRGDIPGELIDRDARENQRMTSIRQKLVQRGLELTESDLLGVSVNMGQMQQVAPSILTERDIYSGLNQEELQEVRNSQAEDGLYVPNTYAPPGMESGYGVDSPILTETGLPMRKVQTPMHAPPKRPATWKAQKMNARLKSGNVVPVWKVIDEKTGMEMPTPFRIEEVADRIVNILNESGNVNDPRIVSVTSNYNKRVQIMKEMKQVKQMIAEGQTSKKARFQQLQSDLASVDYRLGIG